MDNQQNKLNVITLLNSENIRDTLKYYLLFYWRYIPNFYESKNIYRYGNGCRFIAT
jgi:hypothetical protein